MKIFYKSFGCKVNQIEVESIVEKFLQKGYNVSDKSPDIVLINTCCVTEKTQNEVLRFLKSIAKKNNHSKLILTGCLATVFKDEIIKNFPNIYIYSNKDKNKIVKDFLEVDDEYFTVEGFQERTRAFIKVQDGCNLRCSYCIVPLARNIMLSKPFNDVILEIKKITEKGYKEIVISGTRLGAYFSEGKKLKELLKEIEKINGDFRVRLSSLEPMEIDDELVSIVSNYNRFCSYFHIPLQSGSDKVLKSMRRPYTIKTFEEKVKNIRKRIKNVGIYADVIVGYPLESEDDFKKTCKFIENLELSGLHVFTYSPRPYTDAVRLKDLNPSIKKERSSIMHEIDNKLRINFAKSMLGNLLDSLSLKRKGNYTYFLTTNFINVLVDNDIKPGQRTNLIIKEVCEKNIYGEVI